MDFQAEIRSLQRAGPPATVLEHCELACWKQNEYFLVGRMLNETRIHNTQLDPIGFA